MIDKPNDKRNELDTHGVTLIASLEVGDGKPIFGNLQGCIEVASYLTFPNSFIEKGGIEVRYLAFHFAWWFEALERTLNKICLDTEEVQIEFVSKDKLKYCIVVDMASEKEATEIVNAIPDRVNEELAQKIKWAEEKYDINMLKEVG